jgi:metal-responsive CopG/Arc/MetJ family transcriptional regulator
MGAAKIAITIDSKVLATLDRLVKDKAFPNRSSAIQVAVTEKLGRMEHNRLALECAKLTREDEQSLADLGMVAEAHEWPEY